MSFTNYKRSRTEARGLGAPSRNHDRSSASVLCGVERWTVKTLQDRPRLLPAQRTTIRHLVSLPRPAYVPQRRLSFEHHIYTVTGAVTLDRLELDQDLHLVLWQIGTGSHLIAEAPNAPFCTPGASALRKRQMRRARRAARICGRARVTGVAFWDYFHRQTGVAPNAIELHPILGFDCRSN
jgi:hypothetical protein